MKSEIRTNSQTEPPYSKPLYRLGGVAALLVVLTALLEIVITFLPGGYTTAETVIDWFTLLQENWFLGLRNLGLLNIMIVALGIPVFLALYMAHQPTNQTFAALALIISFIGVAVFYATNRAFPMLDLSMRYATAVSESERAMLVGAGQVMLTVGQSHTPGTFLAFLLSEIGGFAMSLVMLQGRVFSRAGAYAGIAGFGLLFVFEVLLSFVPPLHAAALIIAMGGGIANMTWYILIALRLFQLGQGASKSTLRKIE